MQETRCNIGPKNFISVIKCLKKKKLISSLYFENFRNLFLFIIVQTLCTHVGGMIMENLSIIETFEREADVNGGYCGDLSSANIQQRLNGMCQPNTT